MAVEAGDLDSQHGTGGVVTFMQRTRLESSGKPPVRRTVSTASLIREVRSEDEFRAAIASLAASNPVGTLGDVGQFFPRGGEIVISTPISLTAPIEIPPRCLCLTIRSYGYIPITPLSVIAQMFLIRAPLVTIDGLFASAVSDGSGYATTFIEIADDAGAGDFCTIRNNYAICKSLVVDNSSGSTGAEVLRVERNVHDRISGTQAAITIRSEGAVVEKNRLNHSGAGDAITVTGIGYCAIEGNYCEGGAITTSACTTGQNVIDGNRRVGTITQHVTDRVGLNS